MHFFLAFLERKSGGLLPEHIKLQGMLTQLYVAMDKKGRLYGEVSLCMFMYLYNYTCIL